MDTVEVEKHERLIIFVAFLTRIAAVAALITVAAWLIANVALDWLGAPISQISAATLGDRAA